MQSRRGTQWLLGVVLPLALVVIILTADYLEGPKTAYVGVLAAVPMLSAVFARPLVTLAVGVITWLAALGFGLAASDGNVPAQRVRLVIIAGETVEDAFERAKDTDYAPPWMKDSA